MRAAPKLVASALSGARSARESRALWRQHRVLSAMRYLGTNPRKGAPVRQLGSARPDKSRISPCRSPRIVGIVIRSAGRGSLGLRHLHLGLAPTVASYCRSRKRSDECDVATNSQSEGEYG